MTDVLHDSCQTVDEQREGIMCGVNPVYTPLDLAVTWILEKAAEVERAQSSSEADREATFVAPRWLSKHHCDQQMANIKFWKGKGGISEAKAEQLRGAVEKFRGTIPDYRSSKQSSRSSKRSSRSSKRSSKSSKRSSSASSSSSPPIPASASLSVPVTQVAERNPNQVPNLKGAKVAPLDTDSEGQAEQTPSRPLPPIGTAVEAPVAGR